MNLEINLKDAIPSFKVNDVHIVDLSDAANAETKEKVMNIIGTQISSKKVKINDAFVS